jgi:hypothetical protein
MEELRKMEPRSTLLGSVVMPSGDVGYCHFLDPYIRGKARLDNAYIGGAYLHCVGEDVARADVHWENGETKAEHFARFCDALEADFVLRHEEAAA